MQNSNKHSAITTSDHDVSLRGFDCVPTYRYQTTNDSCIQGSFKAWTQDLDLVGRHLVLDTFSKLRFWLWNQCSTAAGHHYRREITVLSKISGVDRRCDIHTARRTGCKRDVQETSHGITLTMFRAPQPQDYEYYHVQDDSPARTTCHISGSWYSFPVHAIEHRSMSSYAKVGQKFDPFDKDDDHGVSMTGPNKKVP
ncbi:hypothetical protein TNCV_3153341 [Trichonephila clavipes]|nr:hypothetical protein TNCV_3153341 [Trichonephila clavipes]